MWTRITCVLVLLASGCGLASFDVTEKVAPQTIPGSSSGSVSAASSFEMTQTFTWDELPRGKGFADGVTLKSANFDITAPAAGTFDFVKSVVLSISAPTSKTLPEVQIASGTPTAGSGSLALQPTNEVDLLPYVRDGAIVRAVGTGTQPNDTTTVEGRVVLTVHL